MTRESYDLAMEYVKELDLPASSYELYFPPPAMVEPSFNYQEAVSQYGASSSEAKLILARDDAFRKWKGLSV